MNDEREEFMIYFHNISFSYNKKVNILQNLNLHIPESKIFGLLGHNGAGKTTIFRIITGVLKVNSGKVEFNTNIFNAYRKNVSYMPENNSIYEKLTARENLFFRGKICCMTKKDIKERSEEILKQLKLDKRADEKVGYYSNGMKKRISLACALISKFFITIIEITMGIHDYP